MYQNIVITGGSVFRVESLHISKIGSLMLLSPVDNLKRRGSD